MSVLSACQSAMIRLVGRKPTTIFSSQDQMEVEIADLVTDVAVEVMGKHDWRALTKLHTITGDGSQTEFDLPPDYDRIVLAQRISDTSNWLWGYTAAQSLEEWMTITNSGFAAITPGWWIILGGKMQFSPAPSTGSPAQFAYISRDIGRSATAAPISVFTKDDDEFVLDERLLTLGLIWRWKAQKGLEYAEDMASYELALSENAARDKGSQAIRKGSPSFAPGTRLAWPWPLG